MCEILDVSRSGYYVFEKDLIGKRTLANQQLDLKIKSLFLENKKRYGAPRIVKELRKQGETCSKNRVARRMKNMGLVAIAKKKFKATTDSKHSLPVYSNVLNRDFTTTAINQKWAGDITYIPTKEGWLYLAVIIDLHSRAIIGWSMNKRMTKDLVCNALLMALFKRGFPKKVIMHSDRGGQYASKRHQKLLEVYGLIGSMSRKGNCWDNAIAESFFHTLKVELVNSAQFATREEAKLSIFEYIEGYYNRRRMHSAINYCAPLEFEYAS